MKILLFALALASLVATGCGTDNERLMDPKHAAQDNSTKMEYPDQTAPHYAPGGYGAVGPDGTTTAPTPNAVNPLNPQSDGSILQK